MQYLLLLCHLLTQEQARLPIAGVEVITLRQGFYNVYLVRQRGAFVLVDCGPAEQRQWLSQQLDAYGVTRQNLRFILLTHCHGDHVGNAAYLKARYGSPLVMHAAEKSLASSDRIDSLRMTNPKSLLNRLVLKRAHTHFEPFAGDIYLTGDTTLSSADIGPIQVIHTPSHTLGSVVYQIDSALFGGDLVRTSLTGLPAKPKLHFFTQYREATQTDIAKVLKATASVWYPGHGQSIQLPKRRAQLRRLH